MADRDRKAALQFRALGALALGGLDLAMFVTESDSWRYLYLAVAVACAAFAVITLLAARRAGR
jgi:hypothetical protein